MDKYVVFGNPISHSLSPRMHAFFAKQHKQILTYGTSLAPLDSFRHSVEAFFDEGGKGANVTVPFKQQALTLCAHVSQRAQTTQAVNTLYLDEQGALCGDNTDGFGFMYDMQRLGVDFVGKRVLLLGAGGAAFGIVPDILRAQVGELVVVNRTHQTARDLASQFMQMGTITALEQGTAVDAAFDVVINATSTGLHNTMPPLPAGAVTTHTLCYDLAYGVSNHTYFTRWAREQGNAASAGLGMLVGQGAEAFRIWRGVLPDITPCLDHLLNH